MKNGIKIRKVKLYLIFTKDNKNIVITTLYCPERTINNNSIPAPGRKLCKTGYALFGFFCR